MVTILKSTGNRITPCRLGKVGSQVFALAGEGRQGVSRHAWNVNGYGRGRRLGRSGIQRVFWV
ncbi:hypothetical protein FHX40_1288 [Thermopolyspora flexuosa]|uniref:Uncharacterized protein n=1 Tax=Thermopolyspora flexuosa TaxID=103836 RepID=A0A543IVK6_9ACTN|nr:hypothetical protein FHX40_1288 [Thermopolyspora flexuosa]